MSPTSRFIIGKDNFAVFQNTDTGRTASDIDDGPINDI